MRESYFLSNYRWWHWLVGGVKGRSSVVEVVNGSLQMAHLGDLWEGANDGRCGLGLGRDERSEGGRGARCGVGRAQFSSQQLVVRSVLTRLHFVYIRPRCTHWTRLQHDDSWLLRLFRHLNNYAIQRDQIVWCTVNPPDLSQGVY